MMTMIKKNKDKNENKYILLLLGNLIINSLGFIIVITAAVTATKSLRSNMDASSVATYSSQQFVGEWKLKEIWDDTDSDKPISIPNNDGKPFIFKFDKPTTTTDNDNDKRLNLKMKIGNSMGTSIEFLNDDNSSSSSSSIHNNSSTIHVGHVSGTRMYPGEELMELENYLTKYLPKMVLIEIEIKKKEENNLLIMTTTATSNGNGNGISSSGGSGGSGGSSERIIGQAKIVFEQAVEFNTENL